MKDTTLAPHAIDFFEMNEWNYQEARMMALIHHQAGSLGFALAFFPGLVTVLPAILYLVLLGAVFIVLSPILVPAIIIDNWIYRSFGVCSTTILDVTRDKSTTADLGKLETVVRILCSTASLQKYK